MARYAIASAAAVRYCCFLPKICYAFARERCRRLRRGARMNVTRRRVTATTVIMLRVTIVGTTSCHYTSGADVAAAIAAYY